MPMETRSSKYAVFQVYCFNTTAEKKHVPPLWDFLFSFLFSPQTAAGGAILFFFVANCQHGDRNQLVRRLTFDTDIDSAHGQPARYLARPTNIDDSLEDIRWIHGLGRESLPATSYGILPNQKKRLFFAIRDGWRDFVFCFVQTS